MLERLTKKQADIITVILILIIIGIIIFWINFWLSLPKPIPSKIEEKPPQVSELLKPGEIGEISEKEIEEKGIQPIHPVVFNTSGVILEIKSNRLIVQGSGSNFADQKPRELTLIFTDSTLTMKLGSQIKYQGLEGLKYLKPGMTILIEGNENIRGKIEFDTRYIHIL